MKQIKFSPADRRVIRNFASLPYRARQLRIEIAKRAPLDGRFEYSENLLHFDADLDRAWEATDLHDTFPFAQYRTADATDDLDAVYDFYVYERGVYGDLLTNVQAHYKAGKLVKMTGTGAHALEGDLLDILAKKYKDWIPSERKRVSVEYMTLKG